MNNCNHREKICKYIVPAVVNSVAQVRDDELHLLSVTATGIYKSVVVWLAVQRSWFTCSHGLLAGTLR